MSLPLTAVVVFTLALSSTFATASLAAPNSGAFQQSIEGNKPSSNPCEGYRQSFLGFMNAATTAADDASRKWYNDSAIEYWQEAKAIGCGWVKTNALKGPWIGKMS